MDTKTYCPMCTKELDPHGDCWATCEYESSNATPEFAPLNRKQALDKRLRSNTLVLKNLRKRLKDVQSTITDIKTELKEYESDKETSTNS